MGFVSEVLSGENGITLYYIIGILIFIAMFVIILYRTMTMSKNEILEYKTSILDTENQENNKL